MELALLWKLEVHFTGQRGFGSMQEGFARRHFKSIFLILVVVASGLGWLYIFVNGRRQNEPMQVVKNHFAFYPDYSHGVWREAPCAGASREACKEVTYTIPVQGCGPVTFDWRVFRGDDGDNGFSYVGAKPALDESKYPLYALVG